MNLKETFYFKGKKVVLVSVNKLYMPAKTTISMKVTCKDARQATVKDTRPAKIRTYGKSLCQRYLEEKYER